MAKCKICGTEVTTNFCGNCGTKQGAGDPNPFMNILGVDASATKMPTQEELNGIMSSIMSNLGNMGGFMTQFGGGAKPAQTDEKKKKEARLAIMNHMCPDCGADFADKDDVCKKCGTLLDISNYK